MASASGWRTARRTTQTPRRPNGAGGARGANRSGSASVTSIHAPFTTEVECKMASFTHVENFGVHAPRLILDGHDPVRVSLEAPLKYGPELPLGIMQLEREGSPPSGLRLSQAKLSRKSNQVARGRIRRFESYMPSHAVRLRTENGPLRLRTCGSILRGRVRSAAADGCQASLYRDDGVCCGAES